MQIANIPKITFNKISRRKNHEHVRNSTRYLLNPDSPFAVKEAYINLRTSLLFCMVADKSRNCRTFAITSANPSEGKSVTSANVAVSLAMLGKKTLLIDADMRRPTQNKIWGIKSKGGLCDLLANIDNCAVNELKEIPLSIICTGTIPPNPSELLSSDNMKTFIDVISTQYDYIIIDTPPINSVADARIISKIVDGVVIVARSGKITGNDFINSVNVIREAGGNICGTVINGVGSKADRSHNYYRNYKRYGYGYYRYKSKYYYTRNYYKYGGNYYNNYYYSSDNNSESSKDNEKSKK